ncbi:hypothetical protein M501DRAFT_985963 [Patellaria atrata CBS 101060]|uniref:Uncharacterized protein n=1 Tax=Patellaria atrata CBS 101060 TaxID=1346257 RepID=A0A9P4VNH4_9PEZI|nr:hypothetical protein M501DRAFT_985963 [Patellaria atrata CBS 101060]
MEVFNVLADYMTLNLCDPSSNKAAECGPSRSLLPPRLTHFPGYLSTIFYGSRIYGKLHINEKGEPTEVEYPFQAAEALVHELAHAISFLCESRVYGSHESYFEESGFGEAGYESQQFYSGCAGVGFLKGDWYWKMTDKILPWPSDLIEIFPGPDEKNPLDLALLFQQQRRRDSLKLTVIWTIPPSYIENIFTRQFWNTVLHPTYIIYSMRRMVAEVLMRPHTQDCGAAFM